MIRLYLAAIITICLGSAGHASIEALGQFGACPTEIRYELYKHIAAGDLARLAQCSKTLNTDVKNALATEARLKDDARLYFHEMPINVSDWELLRKEGQRGAREPLLAVYVQQEDRRAYKVLYAKAQIYFNQHRYLATLIPEHIVNTIFAEMQMSLVYPPMRKVIHKRLESAIRIMPAFKPCQTILDKFLAIMPTAQSSIEIMDLVDEFFLHCESYRSHLYGLQHFRRHLVAISGQNLATPLPGRIRQARPGLIKRIKILAQKKLLGKKSP